MIEVDGEAFEEGDEFVQVIKDPMGETSSSFLIERRDEMREIRMSCQLTGTVRALDAHLGSGRDLRRAGDGDAASAAARIA